MKKKSAVDVYSIRVEINGQEKILTLRVGPHFTEVSLAKSGQLAEVVREENQEILFERFR